MAYIRISLVRPVRVKKIITCFTDTHAPNAASAIESHDFWELVFLRRGRMGYRSGERTGILAAGDAVLHAPNVPHNLFGDGKHEYDFFIISFECDFSPLAALAGGKLTLTAAQQDIIDTIRREREGSFAPQKLVPRPDAPICGQQLIALYLELLLIGLLRAEAAAGGGLFSSRTALEESLVADICTYLRERVYGQVEIADLCAHFHYGKSRLSLIFRRVTGDSVMHWYHRRKIEEAQRLLRTTDRSVAEISAALCYDSPQYFSRIFSRHTGICPRDFRAAGE